MTHLYYYSHFWNAENANLRDDLSPATVPWIGEAGIHYNLYVCAICDQECTSFRCLQRSVVLSGRGRLSLEGIDTFQGRRQVQPQAHTPFTQPEKNSDSRAATETLCHINTDNETLGFHFIILQSLALMTNPHPSPNPKMSLNSLVPMFWDESSLKILLFMQTMNHRTVCQKLTMYCMVTNNHNTFFYKGEKNFKNSALHLYFESCVLLSCIIPISP